MQHRVFLPSLYSRPLCIFCSRSSPCAEGTGRPSSVLVSLYNSWMIIRKLVFTWPWCLRHRVRELSKITSESSSQAFWHTSRYGANMVSLVLSCFPFLSMWSGYFIFFCAHPSICAMAITFSQDCLFMYYKDLWKIFLLNLPAYGY